jgi:DNA polymerase III delta prime subunit
MPRTSEQREKHKAYTRKWRRSQNDDYKQRQRELGKLWKAQNPDKVLEEKRRYRARHRDKINSNARDYSKTANGRASAKKGKDQRSLLVAAMRAIMKDAGLTVADVLGS